MPKTFFFSIIFTHDFALMSFMLLLKKIVSISAIFYEKNANLHTRTPRFQGLNSDHSMTFIIVS